MCKKICFTSSSGGHFEQMMMLKPMMETFESFVITEETIYSSNIKDIEVYYVKQINRKEILFLPKAIINTFISLKVFLKERPDCVISLGVLATIPICFIAKIFKKKVIYIESFAKVNSATLTGKILYKFADKFYVQWEEMLSIFPNATYVGGIY